MRAIAHRAARAGLGVSVAVVSGTAKSTGPDSCVLSQCRQAARGSVPTVAGRASPDLALGWVLAGAGLPCSLQGEVATWTQCRGGRVRACGCTLLACSASVSRRCVGACVHPEVVVPMGAGLRAEGSQFLQGHPTLSSTLIREAEQ